jgi:hypothetical protein
MTKFRCWKCGTELCTVQSESFTLSAWMYCPKETCKEPNALSYSFPSAHVECD